VIEKILRDRDEPGTTHHEVLCRCLFLPSRRCEAPPPGIYDGHSSVHCRRLTALLIEVPAATISGESLLVRDS